MQTRLGTVNLLPEADVGEEAANVREQECRKLRKDFDLTSVLLVKAAIVGRGEIICPRLWQTS